jgi:Spy/CpxP family protein refolding chaperone
MVNNTINFQAEVWNRRHQLYQDLTRRQRAKKLRRNRRG